MKIARVHLRSLSPYNQSRQHFEPHLEKEAPADYEKRTWRCKGHYDSKGDAFIPPTALKTCLSEGAKKLSLKIPGKGNGLYTKHFVGGVMVTEGVPLGVNKKDVKPQWLSMSGPGRKGEMGVLRAYPHFDSWEGTVDYNLIDDEIPKPIFERVLRDAGSFTGVGQYRPAKGGYFGRYEIVNIDWV